MVKQNRKHSLQEMFVIFYLAELGYFQPSPEITDGIRQPAIRLHKSLMPVPKRNYIDK